MPRGGFNEFGQYMIFVSADLVPAVHGGVHEETARTLFLAYGPDAPVGHFPTTSRGPGRLRSSERISSRQAIFDEGTAYGAVPGRAEAESGLVSHRPGDSIHITYGAKEPGRTDGYSAIIERGRMRDSRGRITGSLQQPKGWIRQKNKELDRMFPAIVKRALRRVERTA